MGGACLRDHGHPWAAGGSCRAASRGRRQGQLADQPDAARPHARAQLLRAGGDPDPVHDRQPQAERDAKPHAVTVHVGISLGDPGAQRLGHAVPIANRHADGVSVAERESESLELALAGQRQPASTSPSTIEPLRGTI
jgi:hypothetical protein